MKKYIRSNLVTGYDWHDISYNWTQMEENGEYEIKNPMEAVAQNILSDLSDLCDTLTLKKVMDALQNPLGSSHFKVTVEENVEKDGVTEVNPYQITIYSNGCDPFDYNYGYSCSYSCGYTCYKVYHIDEIADEQVSYLVTENILCPTKGVPLREKCYHVPFKSLMEANLYKDIMNGKVKAQEENCAGYPYEGEFKLFVTDIQKITNNVWYINERKNHKF